MKYNVYFSNYVTKDHPDENVLYLFAGEVEAENEEDCFVKTQNGLDDNEMPTYWDSPIKFRSSMVGDIFQRADETFGKVFFVRAVGFKELTQEEFYQARHEQWTQKDVDNKIWR